MTYNFMFLQPLVKIHLRLVESGVELEEWEEALENLRELADCYSVKDF